MGGLDERWLASDLMSASRRRQPAASRPYWSFPDDRTKSTYAGLKGRQYEPKVPSASQPMVKNHARLSSDFRVHLTVGGHKPVSSQFLFAYRTG
jgi:hypothetical protein